MQIVEDDFPHVREVDMKLIELAKVYDCKIVTNDFNLNKVAQLHGVEVLNINELANALKPIVLPGETMRVFILKEGKEYNQGVAYLDDGTMVVVDNAKQMISKTIDISVTSVLQTTAGKMIFGKFDERIHARLRREARGARRHERPQRRDTRQPQHPRQAASSYGRIVDPTHESFRHFARGGPRHPHGADAPPKRPAPAASSSCCWKARRSWCTPFANSRPRHSVTEIVVALRAEDMEWVRELLAAGVSTPNPCVVVEGGNSRQESVENALAALRCRIPIWWRCTMRCGRSSTWKPSKASSPKPPKPAPPSSASCRSIP